MGAIIKPAALRLGDLVAIIAPASPLPEQSYLARGTDLLLNHGFKVRTGRYIGEANGYLAGSDGRRLADLHEMFINPEVKAVFCLRGGYGALRLLGGLDLELIRRHPKIFVGYSDITALHLVFNQIGLVTFHGPMLYPELGGEKPSPYTLECLWRALMVPAPLGSIPPAPGLPPAVTIFPGRAEGVVVGGNLSLVTATLGTPFEINTQGKILFLEEVDEPPYRLDRLLTQLKLAGKLEAAGGIVLGSFTYNTSYFYPEALEVIRDNLAPLGRPCFYGLPAGHLFAQATLPLGIRAHLDATACTLTYLETALMP